MGIIALILFLCSSAWAQVNFEMHDIVVEYGLAYHTLKGEQKKNNTKGQLVTNQNPYWNGAYSLRLSAKSGLKLFGGMQFLRFNDPKNGDLKNEDQVLNQYGLEYMLRPSPLVRLGFFLLQQDHPLYYAKSPEVFEVYKKSFIESGVSWGLAQRRRVGLLWGLGVKGFFIFPTRGGNASTESGIGSEGFARLGWVGPLGSLYQVKGFYQVTTAPNAEAAFTHETLGYCFMWSHSF